MILEKGKETQPNILLKVIQKYEIHIMNSEWNASHE